MWGEDNVSTEVCGDLWLMAMSKDAIRLQANFTKLFETYRFTPCTAHAAGGVDHLPLIEVKKIGINQRFQRQLCRRRITARHRNQIRFF